MDENAKEDHIVNSIRNEKNEAKKEINSLSHTKLRKNERRSRSRSRSQSVKSSKQWMSSNAFINFVQDFRENHNGTKSSRILQLAGERWRSMTPKEKEPYVQAAKSIRNQKQEKQKNEEDNKSDKNTERKGNESAKGKQMKNNKPRKKSKERKRSNARRKKTESDSDSANSAASVTSAASSAANSISSEDLSDISS